jgi:hypothetical protein
MIPLRTHERARNMRNRTKSAIEKGFPPFVNVEPPPPRAADPVRPDFDVRGRGDALVFGPVTSTRSAKKLSVDDGDIVRLKIEGETVVVVDTMCIGANHYRGIIDCFETRPGVEFRGYSVGDPVDFSHAQVFGAQPPR